MSPDASNAPRGFVNAHTHIYSGLAPLGMPAPEPPPASFVQILARVWWRLDRALDDRSLRAAARLYIADALLHGTTTLIDHHESPCCVEGSLDIIADACDELGIRAVLCFGATERNRGRAEAREGLAECRRFIERNTRPLVRGLIGLHAPFTVSDETIQEAAELCEGLAVPLHVHLAEDRTDVDDAHARHYSGPLERLRAMGALRRGAILAHGVHLTGHEVEESDRLGCWIVQNPRSNAHNQVGYPASLDRSSRVALGTDGFVSDMREEAAALVAAAARHGEPPAVAARRTDAGHMLVRELFGAVDDACEIDPDAVVLKMSIAGRPVVEGGRLVSGDLEEIRRCASEAAPRLWRRMAEIA